VRASSEIVTQEHSELRGDTEAPQRTARDSVQPPLEPQLEIGDQEVTIPTTSDADVAAWRSAQGSTLKVLRAHEVSLVASLGPSGLEELLAEDIRALLQFHRMPSYPLVSLTLARANTLSGHPGKPFSFHFDVGKEEDRAVLAQLGEDFRFRLELFDDAHNPVRERRLAAPLAANVGYVMALAIDARKELAPHRRDFAQALNAFASPRYDRLGRGHRLARDFKDSLLDKLDKPASLLAAVAQCGRFSAPPGEEYLVAIRSYPFERWHRRRIAVIKKAIESGLWIGSDLARVAVSEEIVRSRRDLLGLCQENFAKLVSNPEPPLSESNVQANWAALAAESESLGLTGAKPLRPPSPLKITTEEQRLLGQLEQPSARLQAIVGLCSSKSLPGMDPIFRGLAQLDASEAAEAFAAITQLGNQAAESLLLLLSCPSAHLRHGAALALCELRNEEGIDSICESLMGSEGTIWREHAFALGTVGSSAVMPLVARIASASRQGQSRAVWALAYIAHGGGEKPVSTLARGRDQAVSRIANAALELRQRLADNNAPAERTQSEQQFTETFYRAISGESPGYASADLSGPSMLLDEHDLIEAT